MSDKITTAMLEMYEEFKTPVPMASATYATTPRSFHNSETVEWDVIRKGRKVSPVVRGITDGPTKSVNDKYTNKEVEIPVIDQLFYITQSQLQGRQAGDTKYQNVAYQAKAGKLVIDGMREITDQITRTKELMAWQNYIDGVISLKDEKGNVAFTLDWNMKADHKITSGTAWSAASPDIIGDLYAACQKVHHDSGYIPTAAWVGGSSYQSMIDDATIQNRLDNRNLDVGNLGSASQTMFAGGGSYKGTLEVNEYKLDIFTYADVYDDPEDGGTTSIKYLPDAKVVVLAPNAPRQATFGNVPIFPAEQRALAMLPNRISSIAMQTDIIINPYMAKDNKTYNVELMSRPLMIPKAIDAHATISTGV